MTDSDENHLIAERRAKLARLRERGIAFPNDFRRDAEFDICPSILKIDGRKRALRSRIFRREIHMNIVRPWENAGWKIAWIG